MTKRQFRFSMCESGNGAMTSEKCWPFFFLSFGLTVQYCFSHSLKWSYKNTPKYSNLCGGLGIRSRELELLLCQWLPAVKPGMHLLSFLELLLCESCASENGRNVLLSQECWFAQHSDTLPGIAAFGFKGYGLKQIRIFSKPSNISHTTWCQLLT